MDFDEYEYLEKAVENSPRGKEKGVVSANGNVDHHDRKSSKRRSGDTDRESDHRSKRSKLEGESRDRDRERSPSRHRLSPDHRSREDRHRSSRERRDRDKNGEDRNEKDRDRKRERDGETSKDRERDRDRERDKDREREREQSRRSRSRSERYYGEHEMDREKSRDRELRERERERDRESRRYREKKEEVPEPEADPERDQRTVFAYQIPLKADERDVYEFFSKAGKVRDVRLIMDRNSRRSKGVGYIEFYDVMSVPMAIALSGQPLLGQPVMVKPSEAEKNLVQSTAASGAGLSSAYSGGARKLYVGNLHFNMTEDQLRQVFEPFGLVELVQLPLDPETCQCKGFGFVQFTRLEDAKAAQSLNGQLEIAGRTIKVSAVTDQSGMQDVGANANDFDDDDGGSLALNACSRALLMQKLDRSGTASTSASAVTLPTGSVLGVPPVVTHPVYPLGQAPVPALTGLPGSSILPIPGVTPQVDTIGVPSECLQLKNMFDPKLEVEPDFDLDITEDVQEECGKFGVVKHIFVDKNSAGFVYLRFENATSAVKAQRALHGRWFAGKMITATFMSAHAYDAKFPNCK
ncbi:uncharacterized protein [Aristolochia californica]|uniref:uncharacterized protein n=1 Tax=Aristolochia californica TaxID=171875 RepID=UPI0035D84196